MKYTVKFEEMIDSRVQAIINLQKVIPAQTMLLNYLTETKESSEKFSDLVESLKEDISKHEKSIEELTEANKKTALLIKRIKKCDEKTSKLIADIITELGIFNEEVKVPKAPKVANKK